MSDHVQIIGRQFDFHFSDENIYRLNFLSAQKLDVMVVKDPGYASGTVNHFDIDMTEIKPDVYLITWIEPATGNTVTHVDDFENHISYTSITDLASGSFWRMKGRISPFES